MSWKRLVVVCLCFELMGRSDEWLVMNVFGVFIDQGRGKEVKKAARLEDIYF